ncbi:MAG: hypothetical protein M3R38_29090 [Actinomycetota bacterium]|nr:hypothetical protein [Actinomycetota bacterium]
MMEQRTEDFRSFRIGSWERPDPAGIVRRGEAAQKLRRQVEKFGEPPVCFVGSRPGEACNRPAVMEVYGIPMCEAHGEEAASGAIEEIAHDLDQELQRPMHPNVRRLSPHIERALRLGKLALPGYAEAGDYKRTDALLLAAFPLDRERVDAETVAYVRDPDANGRGITDPPYDTFMMDRHLVCRHMRLAFEEGADWLVEALEPQRANVAAQAAYALALDREAGLR